MDATDKDRKKAWKLQERAGARASFPIADELPQSMFEAVDERVGTAGCDHTLRFTKSWIAAHQQPEAEVLLWLREHGGFCDCEVLGNAADHWEQIR